MQGLWKEKLGGWNHKDSKRKKQTRRHSFKDKAKGIARRNSCRFGFNSKRSKKHGFVCYDIYIRDGYVERESVFINSIYGIKLQSHRDWATVYPESQGLRKRAQKMANKMTRSRAKQWLRNGDFEKEIKNHSLEKSIAWEIH